MAIRVKRVYDKPEPADGVRILVDRLWPRGLTKEEARVDLWLKEVAPSTELRQWFHRNMDQFAEFRRRYLAELAAHPEAAEPIREHLRAKKTVTLLYGIRHTEKNHAQLLAEYVAGSRRSTASRGGKRPAAKSTRSKSTRSKSTRSKSTRSKSTRSVTRGRGRGKA